MDFGNAQKVQPVLGITLAPRADVIATQGSVKVELPPEQTVQSARAGDAVKVDIRERSPRDVQTERSQERRDDTARQAQTQLRQAVADTIERKLTIEPKTRDIVLKKTNLETGETVETVPDEATLKFRRFARELADRTRAGEESTARYVERSA